MNIKHDNCAVNTHLFHFKSWLSCTGNTYNNTKYIYECLNVVFLFHCLTDSLFVFTKKISCGSKARCYKSFIATFLLHLFYSIIPCFILHPRLYIPLSQVFVTHSIFHYSGFFTPSIFHYSGFFYKLYTVYSIFPCFVTPCKFHCSMSFYTLYIPLFKFLLNPVCAIIPCFWNTFIFVILPFC